MRIAVLGHSMIHIRQHKFYEVVAAHGHNVLLVCPDEWPNNSRPVPVIRACGGVGLSDGTFQLQPLETIIDQSDGSAALNNFRFIGLEDQLTKFQPDVVYVNQEPGSRLLDQVRAWADHHDDVILAGFTWENIAFNERLNEDFLGDWSPIDLMVCGNDAAAKLVGNKAKTVILPQVGVDVDHFQPRETERSIGVAYIGRPAPEKGVELLRLAWPLVQALPWKPWLELPWWYSQCKVVVCPSLDTPYWREQAMPYVAVEAMACGARAVVSDGGSIPFWMMEFSPTIPAPVSMVAQGRAGMLSQAIEEALNEPDTEQKGREWVVNNLGHMTIARQLIDAFGEAIDAR